MQLSVQLLLLSFVLSAPVIIAAPPSNPPSRSPSPDHSHGTQPPPGEAGSWNDHAGNTHAAYGNHPLGQGDSGGIPYHAGHVETNQAQHPGNAGLFPVNNDNAATKKKLREDIIGNKPTEPGMSRDHKPPNIQKMPGLTTAQRKGVSSTKNLPTGESNAEWKLLGQANTNAHRPGATGQLQLHPNIDSDTSRASSRQSLQSLPPGQRPSRIPGPKSNTVPASTSPRKLRSGGPVTAPGAAGPSTPHAPSTPPNRQIPQPGFLTGRPSTRPIAPAPRPQGPAPGSPGTPTPAPRRQSMLPIRKKPGTKRALDALLREVLRRRALEFSF
ncbi:Glutamine-rich protein 2 [Xylographa pallens]|nr:Glutamine-rich protein 2 [Xylographa pallens]